MVARDHVEPGVHLGDRLVRVRLPLEVRQPFDVDVVDDLLVGRHPLALFFSTALGLSQLLLALRLLPIELRLRCGAGQGFVGVRARRGPPEEAAQWVLPAEHLRRIGDVAGIGVREQLRVARERAERQRVAQALRQFDVGRQLDAKLRGPGGGLLEDRHQRRIRAVHDRAADQKLDGVVRLGHLPELVAETLRRIRVLFVIHRGLDKELAKQQTGA
jgi:hypothetical protein